MDTGTTCPRCRRVHVQLAPFSRRRRRVTPVQVWMCHGYHTCPRAHAPHASRLPLQHCTVMYMHLYTCSLTTSTSTSPLPLPSSSFSAQPAPHRQVPHQLSPRRPSEAPYASQLRSHPETETETGEGGEAGGVRPSSTRGGCPSLPTAPRARL